MDPVVLSVVCVLVTSLRGQFGRQWAGRGKLVPFSFPQRNKARDSHLTELPNEDITLQSFFLFFCMNGICFVVSCKSCWRTILERLCTKTAWFNGCTARGMAPPLYLPNTKHLILLQEILHHITVLCSL